ncbi:TorD/DmsD family molecular chaperone [Shewanella subflava]|uniref:Molecular chaperone TorD family protein n=1 Tax=Shewanella subflava TaxID=2986476 RepID=A0ABT3IA25_9GAMM|nr:molecular chaperone TorD family protein [Shewanella subflava]MCW3172908.1 molecular chaperone TorD family protein [Shewanella subflava]
MPKTTQLITTEIVMNQATFENSAAICNVLSCMLFNTPTEAFYQHVNDEIITNWPTLISPTDDICIKMKKALCKHSFIELSNDYKQLFVGPGVKSAYPWGSVYTDKDQLVNGQSCIEFEQFCQHNNIDINTAFKQPRDHIGLIIAVLGKLMTEKKSKLSIILLTEHLLPWVDQFLTCVKVNAITEFYRGVGDLLKILIFDLQILLNIKAK